MKISKILVLLVATCFLATTVVACGGGNTDSAGESEESEEVAEEAEEEEVSADEAAEEEVAEEEEATEGEEVAAAEGEEEGEVEAVEFTLVNETDRPLTEFYVSAPEDELWGENLIPEGYILASGSEVGVIIDDGRPGCDYDIKGVLGESEDGSVGAGELIHSGVEICDGAVYTYK
ncbi:hypothetical protein VB712_09340 [Spirulina sp. CCNP1310]|uniref:hypothetical protein n=1 Tax=Spirulina sp. CCNP1310 TaxID=3110249 RepID=UPI002B20921B|nr:hypothetical protein [Spirulina sp. CCNP1310]MEA5419430.1 hypothetical protein [Spirulina sp. CCNP1310]